MNRSNRPACPTHNCVSNSSERILIILIDCININLPDIFAIEKIVLRVPNHLHSTTTRIPPRFTFLLFTHKLVSNLRSFILLIQNIIRFAASPLPSNQIFVLLYFHDLILFLGLIFHEFPAFHITVKVVQAFIFNNGLFLLSFFFSFLSVIFSEVFIETFFRSLVICCFWVRIVEKNVVYVLVVHCYFVSKPILTTIVGLCLRRLPHR